ncbi:rhamnosyl transferase [Aureococcus anophagefferens]|nr:rhamnosyl transferase [Aureococcus anophagefferens]
MLWLHIHNAGGTSIRTLAETYGERPLEPATKNWNLWLHAKETWRTISCREKVDLFKRQAAATWTMIERPFDAADAACAELAYGTTLRSPVSTMLSTIVTNNVDVDALFDALERRGSPLNASIPHDYLIEEGALLGHFDNYFVRSLNGRDVSQAVGLGMLTEAHLDTALERLRRFDVVLVLEDGAALDDAPLRSFRGWPAAEGDAARHNAHSAASKARALAGGLEGDAGVALRERRLGVLRANAKLDERLLVAARDMARSVRPPCARATGRRALDAGDDPDLWRARATNVTATGPTADCETWFDGCNTCAARDGRVTGCTRKLCATPDPPKCLKKAPATGGVKLLNVGHGTSGTRSLYEALCAAGYVALHFNQVCNVNETLPAPRAARLLDAHARATALFAEASWTRDHLDGVRTRQFANWFALEKQKLRAQGQYVSTWPAAKVAALKARYEPREHGAFSRVRALCRGAGGPHCGIESWLAELRAAVAAVIDGGAEALLDAPYDRMAAFVAARAPDVVVAHTNALAAGVADLGAALGDDISAQDEAAGVRAYEASVARRRTDALRAVGRDRYLEMSWWDAGGHFDRVVKALRPARTLRRPLAAALDADGRVAWHFAAASFAHVVVTRFDDGEATLPALLEARLLAFEAVTYPSLAQQTTTEFASCTHAPGRPLARRLRALFARSHFFLVDDLPDGADACGALARVGVPCGREVDFALTTTLEPGEGLHADFLRAAQAAVEKDAPATVCAAGALEWRPVHWDATRQYTKATLKAADAIPGRVFAVDEPCARPGATAVRSRREETLGPAVALAGVRPLRETLVGEALLGAAPRRDGAEVSVAALRRDGWLKTPFRARHRAAWAYVVDNAKTRDALAAQRACAASGDCGARKAGRGRGRRRKGPGK